MVRVATGQGKVKEIHGQGKFREFLTLSGKFGILLNLESRGNSRKLREI